MGLPGSSPPRFGAHDKIANGSRCPAIAIDEWVNEIQAPQRPRGQSDRIRFLPMEIHAVDEIFHLGGDAPMIDRLVIAYYNGTLAIFASSRMQACDSVVIERLDQRGR
jgi:hypothetical protein